MTEKPYTNLDLDTAEQLLIAAGKPELAQALYHQAQGVRNLVQGEWGQSFVNSLEGLLKVHIAPLLVMQKETQDGVAALGSRFQAIEQGYLELIARLTADELRLDSKRLRIEILEADVAALRIRIDDDVARRLAALEARADG